MSDDMMANEGIELTDWLRRHNVTEVNGQPLPPFRHGNRNARNIYFGAEEHVAVIVGLDETNRARFVVDALNAFWALGNRPGDASVPGLFWLRRWMKGDDEPPAGMDRFRDVDGNLIGRDASGNWLYLTVDGKPQDDSCSVPWSDLDDEYDVGWPLSPIAPSAEVSR
jgi:hypothetical protein